MLLSARMLNDVANVNTYTTVDSVEFTEGDAPTIYFQLIDASLDKNNRPAGRRYMPASGATLEVVVHNIDDAKKVTRFATQPYATDPSIWSLQLSSTDVIRGTCSLKLTLVQGASTIRGHVDAAISAHSQVKGW